MERRHNSSALPSHSEYVIIGAGIMGLLTGLKLSDSGREVVILDKAEPWREASAVNAGGLGVQNKRLPLIPLAVESIQAWKNFQEELGDVGFMQTGGIRVATSHEEAQRLQDSIALQDQANLPVQWLERKELVSRIPWIGEHVCAATYCEFDSIADPLIAGAVFQQAVKNSGAGIFPNTEAVHISRQDSGYAIETSGGSITCSNLIIAAAVWSRKLACDLDVDLPIGLDVNIVTVTEPAPPIMDRMLSHIKGILTIRQYPNGTCVIGGGWQGAGNLETGRKEIDYVSFLSNVRLAAEIIPALKQVNIVRSWSGFEGVTPDSLPLLGRIPGHDNAYIIGCVRGGWTVAPVLSRLLFELITGEDTSYPIDEFNPGRFLP
jgi:sarcosine oxidase subunit beta